MRNTIIDNIRGLCMLGVIGIHIGSLALAPNNFTLYLVLEVLSRYSVPMFFFISGYGLAVTDKSLLTGENFSYADFLKKRLRGAGLPYLCWSLFYIVYFKFVLPPGYMSLHPFHVAFLLFFGLACYHLYFMVILLWFYASYPLWRALLRTMLRHDLGIELTLLFLFQLAFNWWTTHPGIDVSTWPVFAKNFFNFRLNYLPLHYLLIFMGGMLAAVYWDKFLAILRRHSVLVIGQYLLAIIYLVASAYKAFTYDGYNLIALANTFHQLSPQGLVYTIASVIFFCWLLDVLERRADNLLCSKMQSTIALLAGNSMLIYYIHPLLLDWMTSCYTKFGIIMTVKKVSLSYVLLIGAALAASIALTKLFRRSKLLGLLFMGK